MANDSTAPTEEQAAQALLQLTQNPDDLAEPAQIALPEPPAKDEPTQPVEQPPDAGTGEPAVAVEPAAAEDDLDSLRARITQLESDDKERESRHEGRMRALQQRTAQSDRIVRDRLLRKSTAADNALRLLKSSRTESGVPEAEVDKGIRELEGTMHQDSASYVAPEAKATTQEDQILVLNDFLNEQAMTGEEADEFGKWIKTDATTVMSQSDQDVARESLGGFLRLAHTRWREGMREPDETAKVDTAVGGVQSVQRTQKAAARAASASTAAPRKQPAGPKTGVKLDDLTSDDISTLVRQSMDQYR